MARKKAIKTQTQQPQYRCRDCQHSYDWHSEALDGHLILCRCPYKGEGGKWCIFLNDPQCNNFELRQTQAQDGKAQ